MHKDIEYFKKFNHLNKEIKEKEKIKHSKTIQNHLNEITDFKTYKEIEFSELKFKNNFVKMINFLLSILILGNFLYYIDSQSFKIEIIIGSVIALIVLLTPAEMFKKEINEIKNNKNDKNLKTFLKMKKEINNLSVSDICDVLITYKLNDYLTLLLLNDLDNKIKLETKKQSFFNKDIEEQSFYLDINSSYKNLKNKKDEIDKDLCRLLMVNPFEINKDYSFYENDKLMKEKIVDFNHSILLFICELKKNKKIWKENKKSNIEII